MMSQEILRTQPEVDEEESTDSVNIADLSIKLDHSMMIPG